MDNDYLNYGKIKAIETDINEGLDSNWYNSYINNYSIKTTISNNNISKEILDELFFEKIDIDIPDLENWTIISSKTTSDFNCRFSIKSIKEAWVKEFKIYVKTIDSNLLIFADPNYDSNWIDKEEIIEVVNKIIKSIKQEDNLEKTILDKLKGMYYNNNSSSACIESCYKSLPLNSNIINNNIKC